MSSSNADSYIDDMTLDPPGTIAVVGGGPLGVEAALYGRYLGYNVTLIEAEQIGKSLVGQADNPLAMLPDRCLSPLAVSALKAHLDAPEQFVYPVTCDAFLAEALLPLSETDLLRGRVRVPFRVTQIDLVPPEPDDGTDTNEAETDDGDLPPDFRLTLAGEDGASHEIVAECVILAIGDAAPPSMDFPADQEYLFRIPGREPESTQQHEDHLREGWRAIAAIFATLGGRKELDLYRPYRA